MGAIVDGGCDSRELPALRAAPGNGPLHAPALDRQGRPVAHQGPGDPGREPREPHRHAGDPRRTAAALPQAHGRCRGGRLLLPQPPGRGGGLADLQHRPARPRRRRPRQAGHRARRQAARPGLEPVALPGGHALAQRRARAREARRRGPGGAAQAAGCPDPRERHQRRDAARALLAQAAARQDHVEAPQGGGLLRRADQAEQGPGRGDRPGSDLLRRERGRRRPLHSRSARRSRTGY